MPVIGLPQHATTPESSQDDEAPPTTLDVLRAAAFGSSPGLRPLPPATDPHERWLRAVALGGQGRYAAARAELTRLRRMAGTRGVHASLAAGTEASLLRQLGRHRAAATLDGRALAAAGPEPVGSRPHGSRNGRTAEDGTVALVGARCDALTGLAADALGSVRPDISWRLLDRCTSLLAAAETDVGDLPFLRQHIRLSWVGAESALAGGDFGRALVHAERAVAESARFGSVRHSVKSDLVWAAASTGGRDLGPARDRAVDVLLRSRDHGLLPLQWAASMLLEGLGGHDDADLRQTRDECAASITRLGGRFASPARK